MINIKSNKKIIVTHNDNEELSNKELNKQIEETLNRRNISNEGERNLKEFSNNLGKGYTTRSYNKGITAVELELD